MKHLSFCFIITVLFCSTTTILGMDDSQPNVGSTASHFMTAIKTSSELGFSRTDSASSLSSSLGLSFHQAQEQTANEDAHPNHPEYDKIDELGRTPLMKLILSDTTALDEGEDNFTAAKDLIELGAKLNRQDNAGFTALMHICSSRTNMTMARRIQYANLLLNKGSHTNFVSFDKRSNARTLLAILQQTVPETELPALHHLIQLVDIAQHGRKRQAAISPKDWDRATTPSPQVMRAGSRFDVEFK